MPIFQDPDRQGDRWSGDHRADHEQQVLEESWNAPQKRDWGLLHAQSSAGWRTPGVDFPVLHANDRQELIQYLKRSDTPAWPPTHLAESPVADHTESRWPREEGMPIKGKSAQESDFASNVHVDTPVDLASPADIVRPRSALHSGDFREGSAEEDQERSQPPLPGCNASHFPPLGSSPTTPWYTPSLLPTSFHRHDSPAHHEDKIAALGTRSRAPSLGSFSSSYVLKAPTTPLVHQANNTDLDFSPKPDPMDLSSSPDKSNRRRTLPPDFKKPHMPYSPHSYMSPFGSIYTPGRRDALPHQTTRPRRSLTSAYSLQLASSANTPVSRARRPSFASEKSHAPMVGSYEESILRGRMSMNPSKPLDFTAQIGVLGKGACKSNLKCPPHVTIPFPAVFYCYPTSGSGRSISDDNPSPYVGHIDLENALPKDDSRAKRRRQHRSPIVPFSDQADDTSPSTSKDVEARRLREKRSRRVDSPKCPPGGCYRIPQQGQLQVMIKNPNKTAVKLFLVPYDLSDMEPGTKTFIRQRSYSAGPVIDMPLNARKNYGTDRPEASLNTSEDPQDKPTLRYLIHLNICCPSKGRFYLHSSIRVVFANRVPDSQERLRNETQQPDPRYSPYKPSREAGTDKSRRQSMGQSLGPEFVPWHYQRLTDPSNPFHLNTTPQASPPPVPKGNQHMIGKTPLPFQPIPALGESPLSWLPEFSNLSHHDTFDAHSSGSGFYHKLNRGDAGYGGSEAGESLLARRLRGLDVQKQGHPSFDIN